MYINDIHVRMSDLDPFNHVNNGAQCNLFDYSRAHFFEHLFDKPIDWLTFDIVLVHTEFDFRVPIHIHDEVICKTLVLELGRTSIKMKQIFADKNTGEIKTECYCVLVVIDREKNKPKPIPLNYRTLLAKEMS